MSCPDCNDSGKITLFSTVEECKTCVKQGHEELRGWAIVLSVPIPEWWLLKTPGGFSLSGSSTKERLIRQAQFAIRHFPEKLYTTASFEEMGQTWAKIPPSLKEEFHNVV